LLRRRGMWDSRQPARTRKYNQKTLFRSVTRQQLVKT
jgi:hypothetical protein